MKTQLMAILLCLMTVNSCIRPHYIEQPLDIPEKWHMSAEEGNTLCNVNWWMQFDDPVLDALIQQALANNQDLKVAISRVFEFYARLGATNSALYPTIEANAQATRQEVSVALPVAFTPGLPRTFNDFQGFFTFNWELDVWGRLYNATYAAYADLLTQIETRRAVVLKVVSSVANAYITLRQLDLQLTVSRQTLKSRLESLQLAKDRFNLGETSELEVKQAESEVEIAAIRVIEFERDIPLQENLLSVLVGENPHSILRGRSLETFPFPSSIPAGIPSNILQRRPDVMAAEDRMIASNARVAEARTFYFPQISLTGMLGSESADLKRLLTAPAEMWSYGLSLAAPIFNAGKTYYQIKQTLALRDQALYSYRQTVLNAFREVEDALVAYKKNRELAKESEKQVKVLKEYLHLAVLRYNEGETDYLNVLDAERQLFNAELSLVQAQSDSFLAVVDLYSALGGGWIDAADTEAISY